MRSVLTTMLLLVACAHATAQWNEPVTLHRGESAEFPDRFVVTYNRVVNDSRCPANVVCVWKGDVTVELTAGGSPFTLELDRQPRATVLGHTVELRAVAVDGSTVTIVVE